jgi:RIH domain
MRELRVIESLVEILHVPFASGAFNFVNMTQDMAILQTCKLTYQLLSLIVKNYRLNELYASQWIGLYLKHILETESTNQTGADAFMT